MLEADSRKSFDKISLAIDGGRHILRPTIEFLQSGGLKATVESNGQLHINPVDDDHIGSITVLRGSNVVDRLVARVATHDLGIIGRDTLVNAQNGGMRLEEIHRLGFSRCQVAVFVPVESSYKRPDELNGQRVATNLTNLASKYFRDNGAHVKIVRYDGKQEGAPAAGVAEGVVAVYDTGRTASLNHLRLLTYIMESEAVLVASTGFLKRYGSERIVEEFIARMRETSQNPAALVVPAFGTNGSANRPFFLGGVVSAIEEVVAGLFNPR